MEATLVKPKNQKELKFFNKTKNEISYEKEKISEGDIYYPELDKKIKKARQNRAEGKTIHLKQTDSAEDFWRQIRECNV